MCLYHNYAKKLHARLKWVYKIAQENSQRESEHHKQYYDKRMRCMRLKPDDLVLVHAKAPSGDHKIADSMGRHSTLSTQSISLINQFFMYSLWML